VSAQYVYRVYDTACELIYVGCTNDLFGRLAVHEEESWWAPQVAKVAAKVYPTAKSGLAAELKAIHTEHPRWNVKGRRWKTNRDWAQQHYVDYVTACLRAPVIGAGTLATIASIREIYRKRFGAELPSVIPGVEEVEVACWAHPA
jgi:hypothetical protein